MHISLQLICDWAGTTPGQQNFKQAERILHAGHLIKCGKKNQENDNGTLEVTALCLVTSNLRGDPHEISAKIAQDGQVFGVVCSCEAGTSEECKHRIATLLQCYETGVENLASLSCTDGKCVCKKDYKKAIGYYEPVPWYDHAYLKQERKISTISSEKQDEIKMHVVARLPQSAFVRHA